MTTIGYAVLQVIPSLDGMSRAISKQLDFLPGMGKATGKSLGDNLAAGVDQASAKVEAATGKVTAALKKVEDQTGKVKVAEAQLQALRDKGVTDAGRLAAAEERVAAAKRNLVQAQNAHTNATTAATRAQQGLTRAQEEATRAQNDGEQSARRFGRSLGDMDKQARAGAASLKNFALAAGGIGRTVAVGTIGFSALLGAATGVANLLAGPMVAALSAVGAAMGVAAGAAAGILAPALGVAKLGFMGLSDAVKAYTTVSAGGASTAKAVASAEKDVERAKRDSRDAERDLTRARKDAVDQIKDMNLQLRGAALSEKDAQLSLLEARRDLQNLGRDGAPVDMIDRERAVLRVQEAEQRLAETQNSNSELSTKTAEANRLGVEGSDQVVQAKRRVVDANQAVADAEQQLADARSQGSSGVDPFDAMIGQRMAPLLDAVKNVRHAITDNFSAALVPAFASLGGLLDGLRPKMGVLATTIGGVGTAIAASISGPDAIAGFDKMITASDTFVGSLKTGLAGASKGLVEFVGTAADTFKGAGAGINDVLLRLGDWLRSITPEQMTAAFTRLEQVLRSIGNVVGPIFSALRQLGGISAPALAPGFKAIGDAIKQATPGIMQMARELMPALGQVMQNLAPILPSIVDSFRPWASVIATLAPPLATIVSHLGPLAPLLLGATLAVKGISAAAKAWTAVQGALNVVLSANPIGLVVLAIAALAAGVIYAYKHSETFRKIVDAAWKGIKTAAEAVVKWFTDTAWPFLKQAWEAIGAGWTWLVTKAEEVWTGVRTKFTSMVDWFKGLPQSITNAAKGMWEGLKFGLVEVLNWIGDKWNAFADALSFHIPGTDVDVKIPKMPHFVAAFDGGGFTGNLPFKQIAGVVHGGEHVIKAASTQRIENAFPGLLDYLNKNGKLPGYEIGGAVAGQIAAARRVKAPPRASTPGRTTCAR